MKKLFATSYACLATAAILSLTYGAPPEVKIPSPSSALDATQPSLMPTTNPPPKVPSVQELRHKRPVPHGVLQQAAEKANGAPTQVAAAAPGGPVTLQSAQAAKAAPAAPVGPSFADGVRLGVVAASRNPDVRDLNHLLQIAGGLWNAEQAQRAQQASKP